MIQTKTRLTSEEKEALAGLARRRGVTESELLRQMIRSVTGGLEVEPVDTERRSCQVNIRLDEHERDKLAERSAAEGYRTPTTWAASAVRAALHQDAVLSDTELEELREATREIAAIGRNLNQIARALNADPDAEPGGLAQAVVSVAEKIEDHKAAVSALIGRNLNRWEVVDDE
jgi:hypothetical protein